MKDIFIDLIKMFIDIFIELFEALKNRDFKLFLEVFILSPIMICLVLEILAIYAIISLVCFPFLYPLYISSAFYKKFKRKYFFGNILDTEYLFYNYAIANKLDIKFVRDYQNGIKDQIYMEKNGVIYVFDEFTSMWFENNECLTYMEDDMEDIEISKYINEHYKNYKMPVRVVVKAKNLSKPSLDEAYQCEHIYVFKKLSDLKKL